MIPCTRVAVTSNPETEQQAQLASLDSLPRELRGPFKKICKLAFTGVMQNKITYFQSDLEAIKDSAVVCEVGLLQATPSILSDGRTVYYNFLSFIQRDRWKLHYIDICQYSHARAEQCHIWRPPSSSYTIYMRWEKRSLWNIDNLQLRQLYPSGYEWWPCTAFVLIL